MMGIILKVVDNDAASGFGYVRVTVSGDRMMLRVEYVDVGESSHIILISKWKVLIFNLLQSDGRSLLKMMDFR